MGSKHSIVLVTFGNKDILNLRVAEIGTEWKHLVCACVRACVCVCVCVYLLPPSLFLFPLQQ